MQQNNVPSLQFDNRFVRDMPADAETANYQRQVMGASYSRVKPTPVAKPHCVAYAHEMAAQLGLTTAFCESPDFAEIFSGNRLLPGMDPYALCYGGHQFGNWAGQLGDGRAINLGEIVTPHGEHLTLQLKGAGATPYSRNADGLAVLRSSIREFVCSEAMFHLGVPTTRALSLVVTGEQVTRDMFYDGSPQQEPGAIVCRVAPSFTRFGCFELPASRNDLDLLRRWVDYTIRTDFPALGEPSPAVTIAWFREVCRLTAVMIAHWMRVGFVHGVMNTDNMSILGLTIDYGPYGWLEDYNPDWTPNTTDAAHSRYRYGHQPQIAQWNLFKLANAIFPLVEQAEPLQEALSEYAHLYTQQLQDMMTHKLGLQTFDPATDEALHAQLQTVLQLAETDMTIFYRRLSMVDVHTLHASDDELFAPLLEAYYQPAQLTLEVKTKIVTWLRNYQLRVQRDAMPDEARIQRMHAVNPLYVCRNYLAQLAIDKATAGDYTLVSEWLEVLRHPYTEQPGKEAFAQKRPEWARHRAGCSMLSCSS